MARKSKALVKEKGVKSSADPKPGKIVDKLLSNTKSQNFLQQ